MSTEAKQVTDTLLEIRRRISSSHHATDWQEILQMVSPYLGKPSLAGIDRHHSDGLISMLWAVAGDCYRELGHPLESAEAYCTALRFRADTGFSEYYAEMVIKHSLTDHYSTAIQALEVSQENWQARPLWLRIFANLRSMWLDWREYKRLWCKRSKLLKQLHTLHNKGS